MGRCYSCAERLELKVRTNERNYNNPACRTVSRPNRKGDNSMFGKIVGWTLLAIASFAFGFYMIVAIASV